jgi:hypothetical protein
LKEQPTPILLRLFHEIGREETPLNSFYEGSITFIPKLARTHKKIIDFNKHRHKNLQ